jgi:hypothetical protein
MTDERNAIRQIDLILQPGELLNWVYQNRYIPDLTYSQRNLYRIEPLCTEGESPPGGTAA